jgi:hypothetical protein
LFAFLPASLCADDPSVFDDNPGVIETDEKLDKVLEKERECAIEFRSKSDRERECVCEAIFRLSPRFSVCG